jgi:G3E family GTPase
MPPGDARFPVNIRTGFLGSGKTTVLRHVLRDPAFANTAVLINEFGEVGLDHLLVGALDEAPVLLQSGCICCSIRGDLSRAVRDLFARRQRGEVPPFGRVIVETTGLADPTPILATLTSDLVIRRHFRPGNIVATLDALHAERGLEHHGEVARQAAIADRLIVTKTDLADGGAVARLRETLRRLNPAAPVVESVLGVVDPDVLIGQDIGAAGTRMMEARHWMQGNAAWLRDGGADKARHGRAITSFCLRLPGKLDWSAFGLWFSMLAHRHGEKLLRVKGILDVEDSETPVAIHAVQHVIHAPEHLPEWPDAERGSRIVFITQGLEQEAVERSLRAFHRLTPPAARAAS